MAYEIKSDCIICGACEAVCPVEAIEIGEDIYEIDADKCIECQSYYDEPQCVNVCPVNVIFKKENI